jgi:outer membrane protein OmpA-like peptidoglycan-associated protein
MKHNTPTGQPHAPGRETSKDTLHAASPLRSLTPKGLTILLLALTLVTASLPLTAQNWQVGFMMGGANYQGDLRQDFLGTEGWRSAFGVSLHRVYSNRFQVDAQLVRGFLGGNDLAGPYPDRNLSFHTPLTELSLTGRLNLVARPNARVVPYLAAGLAGFHIDPFAFDNSGQKQKLYPLSTEGQGFISNVKKHNNLNLSVPLGGGLTFRVGKRSFLDFEAMFRKTFTDYIDDVSGAYVDRTALQNARGAKAVEMAFRAKGTYPPGGTARGNVQRSDWYHTLSMRLRVPLGKPVEKVAPVVAPVVPEPVADRDKDGVPDAEDACPDVPGLAKYKGCPIPDTDRDGINDEQDKCPNVPGSAKYDGCPPPDTDGDGLNDEIDKCPTVAGLAKYDGCPIPDTDGDGLNDEEDRCPTIPGPRDNGGCPKIDFKAENIQFATNTADLTAAAKTELNKLVTILSRDYPNVRVGIEGHTDNVGKPEANQALSEKRANAVKTYLVGKGIDAGRLDAAGYGMTQPVADNATPQGRARNRRVAFRVSE